MERHCGGLWEVLGLFMELSSMESYYSSKGKPACCVSTVEWNERGKKSHKAGGKTIVPADGEYFWALWVGLHRGQTIKDPLKHESSRCGHL